jgi:hypothetical protein
MKETISLIKLYQCRKRLENGFQTNPIFIKILNFMIKTKLNNQPLKTHYQKYIQIKENSMRIWSNKTFFPI